jgi:hypothetical protein
MVVEPTKSAAEPAVGKQQIPEALIRHESRADGGANAELVRQRDRPAPASCGNPEDLPDESGAQTGTPPRWVNPAAASLVDALKHTLGDGGGDIRAPGELTDLGAPPKLDTADYLAVRRHGHDNRGDTGGQFGPCRQVAHTDLGVRLAQTTLVRGPHGRKPAQVHGQKIDRAADPIFANR